MIQSASGRSSARLIAQRTSAGAFPTFRIVALRAMTARSRKSVKRRTTSTAAGSSASVISSVSASASFSTYVAGSGSMDGLPATIRCSR